MEEVLRTGTAHWTELLRTCSKDVRAALNECLAVLIDDPKRAYSGSMEGNSLQELSFPVYLAEMMTLHQPGALLEYLRWLHETRTGVESDGARILMALECVFRTLREFFPEHSGAIEDFHKGAAALVPLRWSDLEETADSRDPLEPMAQEYLQALLETDRTRAWEIVESVLRQGFSIQDVYLRIFQQTQYEIGRLWQRNHISVAQEHYCTAATQLFMTRLYPRIFSERKKDRCLVAACAGGELHELGVRMVADFFEMDGWDTFYLGAGATTAGLLEAVETRLPHVVGLSATMPAHVNRVADLVENMRRRFGSRPKILVGGRPFKIRPNLWRDVGADGFAPDARAAVALAERLAEEAA